MTFNHKTYPLSLGIITLIASMISLCVGTSFAKNLFSEIGAQGTTFYRLIFSALLLWLIWRPWRFKFTRAYIRPIILYGISLGMLNFLFYMALRTIPLGIAIAIEFCGPLGLALFSSRKKIDFLWITLVIIGLLFLIPNESTSTQSLDPIGLMYCVAAAIFWAIYIIAGQKMSNIHPGQASTLGITVAAITVMPFAVASFGFEGLWRIELFWLGLVVGILSSALPYSLEMISLRSLDRKTFGVLLSLEPAFGAIAGAIILHELLNIQQIIAIICIVSASMGCTLTAKRGKK